MSYLLIILYSMGIISIYNVGSEVNKAIPLVVISIIYIITLVVLKKKNNIYKVNFINIFIYMFILLSIIQGIRIFPQNNLGALKYVSLPFMFLICIFSNTKSIGKFFKFVRTIGAFCVIYGLIEFITGDNIFFTYMNLESAFYKNQFELYGIIRVSTIFGHPIVYGTFLICFFWIMYFYKVDRKLNSWEKIIMILAIINLGLTQSRSCWLTFLATLIIFNLPKLNFNSWKLKRCTLFRIMIIIVFIVILHDSIVYSFDLIINRFNDIFTSDGKASLLQRTGAIELVIKNLWSSSIFEILFGNGLFSTVNLLEKNTIFIQGFTSIDNQYLTVLYENGLFMLILYFIIFISLILKYCVDLKYDKNDVINNISLFIFFTVSINMFFYEAISTKWYSVSMLLFISLGVLSKNLKYISREII